MPLGNNQGTFSTGRVQYDRRLGSFGETYRWPQRRAVRQTAGGEGVPTFLAGKLAPVKPEPDDRLQKLIANLDSDTFAVRVGAVKELADLGHAALPAMRKALAGKPPLEQRKHLGDLVSRAESRAPSAEEVRGRRAIGVLERQGTADSRRVLKALIAGASGAPSTSAAQASLKRLDAAKDRSEEQ